MSLWREPELQRVTITHTKWCRHYNHAVLKLILDSAKQEHSMPHPVMSCTIQHFLDPVSLKNLCFACLFTPCKLFACSVELTVVVVYYAWDDDQWVHNMRSITEACAQNIQCILSWKYDRNFTPSVWHDLHNGCNAHAQCFVHVQLHDVGVTSNKCCYTRCCSNSLSCS